MAKRILIMGLPGSGKTTLAAALKKYLETHSQEITTEWTAKDIPCSVDWFNADEIRRKFNDWDFSKEGRIRQSLRMLDFALECTSDFVICDFVAPLVEMRNNFKADWTIWMDTIVQGRYDDTNKAFIPPNVYDFRITEFDAERWAKFIGEHIIYEQRRPVFDWCKSTVQLLGRYQPWHKGHRALFEETITKTGQVCIMVRDCHGTSNPFTFEQVKGAICRDLDPLYQGQYEVVGVPNIVDISYGRDVGYSINKIELPQEIQIISATKIRKELGFE